MLYESFGWKNGFGVCKIFVSLCTMLKIYIHITCILHTGTSTCTCVKQALCTVECDVIA